MSHGSQIKTALGISALVSFYGIASLIIWFGGSALGIGIHWQIIIIALLLITWPFAILINYFRKKRAARKEAVAAAPPVAGQQAPQQSAASNAPRHVYDELARGTEEAVQWLRSTRLGGGKGGDAVYGLPWFVVAGPPASGKTSLVLGSGLDFHALPSQRRTETKIVRPTQDCEWRVTDSAVLIDTTGRYQSDGPGRDEWLALVETIKKYRNYRPVDGLLITVNAERILRSRENEIEQQAKIVRARLDEIMQRVRVRFPVYLVFTHLDAIEGFKEFFSSPRPPGKTEVWGSTITLDKTLNAHALFDVEFDQLCESLSRRRLIRLASPAPPNQQLRMFNFPQRFASARGKLGLFTSAVFRPNPFSESPMLRGFYFTASITDGGAPAARSDDGADRSERTPQAVGEGYFIDRFFKEVLLRDKDLTATFQASQKRPPRFGAILLALGIVIFSVLTLAAIISFFGNRAMVAQAVERGARVDEITRADIGRDPLKKEPAAARVEVETVDALRETLAELDEYSRNSPPLYLRFGLYSGNSINGPLRNIYFQSITQRFFKPTFQAIEKDLQAFVSATAPTITPAADIETASSEDILGKHYDLLKAYLMLGDPEKVEPTFLASQLEEYWKRSSPPDMEIVSLQQLEFYSRQAGQSDAPQNRAKAELVAEVRRKLTAYPPVNRFYKRMITEINGKTAPVSIDSILEGRGRGVLVGTYTVPGSFTIEGYRRHIVEAIDSAAEEISKDDWVMGTAAAASQTQSTDISKLLTMYLAEYTDQWRRFVRGTSVQPFKTKDDAVTALKALSSTDSPMERIMAEVARNTNFSAKDENAGWWAWIKSFFSRDSGGESGGNTEVEKEFRPLFQFVSSGEGKESSQMSQYRAELRRVLDPLELASADQLAQTSKALLTGKDDIGLQKANQVIAGMLEAFKTAAAEDVAALLKQPLNNLRALLFGGGYEQIEKGWREQIYPQARKLESGFPFTEAGEASLTDLARFLNPVNGQLTVYFNERLASSFDDVQGEWKLKEQGAFRFSDDYVKYLNSARRLREALFPTGGQQPEVSYDLTLQPEPNTDIVIEIDGTRVETRGTSPQSAKFIWPTRAGASGAKITVIPAGGLSGERTFSGEWGLLRMFAAGAPNQSVENQFNLSWTVGSTQVRAILRPSSTNHPFRRTLFTALRAPQNLQK